MIPITRGKAKRENRRWGENPHANVAAQDVYPAIRDRQSHASFNTGSGNHEGTWEVEKWSLYYSIAL